MVACMTLSSCNPVGSEPLEASFEVTPASLTLDPQGGQDFIYVRSAEDWLMRSDVKWVKVVTSSGKASSDIAKATITYEANTSGATREGTITVKTVKGSSFEVKVSQDKFSGQATTRGISTAEDLVAFAQAVNEGASLTPFLVDGVVTLLNDVDASSIKDWTPAGTQANPFTGSFDGKGYTIKNIKWNVDLSEYPDAGIIGYAKNANITGLKVGADGDGCTGSVKFNFPSSINRIAATQVITFDVENSQYKSFSSKGFVIALSEYPTLWLKTSCPSLVTISSKNGMPRFGIVSISALTFEKSITLSL